MKLMFCGGPSASSLWIVYLDQLHRNRDWRCFKIPRKSGGQVNILLTTALKKCFCFLRTMRAYLTGWEYFVVAVGTNITN